MVSAKDRCPYGSIRRPRTFQPVRSNVPMKRRVTREIGGLLDIFITANLAVIKSSCASLRRDRIAEKMFQNMDA